MSTFGDSHRPNNMCSVGLWQVIFILRSLWLILQIVLCTSNVNVLFPWQWKLLLLWRIIIQLKKKNMFNIIIWGLHVTNGRVVRAGVSVAWNVLLWSEGHGFEPQSGRTWDAWYFCLSRTLTKDFWTRMNHMQLDLHLHFYLHKCLLWPNNLTPDRVAVSHSVICSLTLFYWRIHCKFSL